MRSRYTVLVMAVALGLATNAYAHSGRTDSKGGHYNRKTGAYHYHGGGGSSRSTANAVPRTSYRTTTRTRARTGYRKTIPAAAGVGTGKPKVVRDREPEIISFPERKATTPSSAPRRQPQTPTRPLKSPRFTLRFKSGRTLPIVSYREDGSSYVVEGVHGGQAKYPKRMIEAFRPLAAQDDVDVPQSATVATVIDVSTLTLDTGESVRLIGIAADGASGLRRPAAGFAEETVGRIRKQLVGETVRLTYDPANSADDHRDQDGRLLAYVARERDNLDINAELIANGYAHAATEQTFSRLEEFRDNERKARKAQRGLWAP